MDTLARYLETLYSTADDMPLAVDATIAHWRDVALSDIAGAKRQNIGRKRQPAPDAPRHVESILHAQLQLPSHARIAFHRSAADKTPDRLVVINPDEWFVDDGKGSVERGQNSIRGCPYLTDVHRHFDRSLIRQFFVGLRLEDQGAATFLGNECVQFHAFPRTESRIWPHWLPTHADRYEMVGEIATGLLLSIAGTVNGKTFERHDVTRIEHNAIFDHDVFLFASGSANVIEAVQRMERVDSPSTAQSRAGFAVFVPTFVPESGASQLDVFVDHRSRGESPKVMLMYRGATGYEHLSIDQSATPDREESNLEWESVVLPAMTVRISDPGEEGMRIITLVKDGTHISLMTDLGRALALDIASSLAPC